MVVADPRVTAVLMPLWIPLGLWAGPGLNIGTEERPLYEATPVHLIAGVTGVLLSVVVYVGAAYGLLWLRTRRGTTGGEQGGQ
jgi:hypothetical protein